MRTLLTVAAALAVMAGAAVHETEHKVASGVKVAVNKDHSLRPLMPVDLGVEQESGPVADSIMTCDVVARSHVVLEAAEQKAAVETVLRCDGGRVFRVNRILFQK